MTRVVRVDLALVEETGSLGSIIETALVVAASRAETGGELDDGTLGCVFAVSNVSNVRYGVVWADLSKSGSQLTQDMVAICKYDRNGDKKTKTDAQEATARLATRCCRWLVEFIV